MLNWVYKIQEAINYIEEHLEDEISIESVAKAINYAANSFQSMFSAITGYSVGEYIRFRRLSSAVEDLSSRKLSVTEIAFKYGYETVEAFSKAFKRAYDVSPSKFSKTNSNYHKFAPISINFTLVGGFNMRKNFIPGLRKIDWSDAQRTNEYVQCVLSALGALGENLEYDYVAAVSGSCFRTTFSPFGRLDSGLPGVGNALHTIEHTFRMLGYKASVHRRSNFETDKKMIMDSIDKGVPVITIAGVLHYADACLISGYDNDGEVLLGYSAYMDGSDKDTEPHDETGYFRKSNWYNEAFAKRNGGFIVIIDKKIELPSKATILQETLRLAVDLIRRESTKDRGEQYWQLNGLAAQTTFANALLSFDGYMDNNEALLSIMCTMMMYNDKKFAAKILRDNSLDELATIYDEIGVLRKRLSTVIPEDFAYSSKLNDKPVLKEYADMLFQIRDLEAEFAARAENIYNNNLKAFESEYNNARL